MVGADLTLDQLAEIVESVKIAETGFGFLAMSNGNVLAVTPAGEKTLGIVSNGQRRHRLDRSLRESTSRPSPRCRSTRTMTASIQTHHRSTRKARTFPTSSC